MRRANISDSIKCMINNQDSRYKKRSTATYVCSDLMTSFNLDELERELYSAVYR